MTTHMPPHQHDRYRRMLRYFWLFAALQLLAAFLLDSPTIRRCSLALRSLTPASVLR